MSNFTSEIESFTCNLVCNVEDITKVTNNLFCVNDDSLQDSTNIEHVINDMKFDIHDIVGVA